MGSKAAPSYRIRIPLGILEYLLCVLVIARSALQAVAISYVRLEIASLRSQ